MQSFVQLCSSWEDFNWLRASRRVVLYVQHLTAAAGAQLHVLYFFTNIGFRVYAFSYCVGKPSLPSVSDNLYVSGFVQVSTDSRVTIGAENSTVTMDYICQFNGTQIFVYDPLLRTMWWLDVNL